jgi:exonuclease III
MVLTETKLRKINKDRTWLDVLLKNYHHWSAFDWTCGTTICIRKTLTLATQCFPTCCNSKGRIASVILKGTNANLHLIGTYWPSGSTNEAIASRFEMQGHIKSLLDTHRNCTPFIIGDMNATLQASDRSSKRTYRADRVYREFLFSNNFCPCKEETCRPWTHYQATGKDRNNNTNFTFSRIDDIILPSEIACKCSPCTTHELGFLSDHVPLIANIPLTTLNIIFQSYKILHPPGRAQKRFLFAQSVTLTVQLLHNPCKTQLTISLKN